MTTWTIEQENLLRQLCEKELSFAAIADEINRQTESAFSKNAIISKTRHMNLKKEFKPVGSSDSAKRRRNREKNNSIDINIIRKLNAPKIGTAVESSPTPEFLGLTFDQLDNNTYCPSLCRYPHGDANKVFCGHPTKDGSSYCHSHHAICYYRPERRIRY